MIKSLLPILAIMIFSSAHSQKLPSVVSTVDLNRYEGLWYEIARLPNFFERKLKCTSATYSLRKDGKITVLNKGYFLTDPKKLSSIQGVAWVPDQKAPAKLKVQFFWPFSGDYWIMELDKEYRYVLVGDPKYKYLWIPTMLLLLFIHAGGVQGEAKIVVIPRDFANCAVGSSRLNLVES